MSEGFSPLSKVPWTMVVIETNHTENSCENDDCLQLSVYTRKEPRGKLGSLYQTIKRCAQIPLQDNYS